MNKNNTARTVWFTMVIAGCVILCLINVFLWKDDAKLPAPRPDAIATSTAPGETVRIENRTAHYAVTVPRDWYLEKSAGSGETIYPAHDATSNCKIEISALSDSGRQSLADWIAAYLRSDPTAGVSEILRTTTTVDGASAIIWRGILNDETTTLAYVATGTVVYEFAPSVILAKNVGMIDVRCSDALHLILKNFEFIK